MAEKRLFFISGPEHVEAFDFFLQDYDSERDVVVTPSCESQGELTERKISAAVVGDYLEGLGHIDLEREVLSVFNGYPQQACSSSRTVGEVLRWDNIPLWEFISPYFYQDISTMIKHVIIFNHILDAEKPTELICLDTKGIKPFFASIKGVGTDRFLMDRLFRQLGVMRGLRVVTVPLGRGLRIQHALSYLLGCAARELRLGVWLMLAAGCVRSLFERVADFLYRRRRVTGSPKILFFTHQMYWRDEYNPLKRRVERTDVILYPIIARLLEKRRFAVVAYDGNYTALGGLKKFFEKVFRERAVTWRSFDRFFTLLPAWRHLREMRQVRKDLMESERMERVFTYRGVSLWPYVRPRLQFIMKDYLLRVAIWVEAARAMLSKERPELCAIVYETGPLGRAVIKACQERDVLSIGLQHGTFSSRFEDYGRKASIVPSKTVVWGEGYKKILTESEAFSDDTVVVKGNPRTDILVNPDGLFDSQRICNHYGFDPQRPILMVATTYSLNKKMGAEVTMFRAIVEARRRVPEAQWVIKISHNETKEDYMAMMRDWQVHDLVIADSDLYELMYVCDLVVSPPSTLVYEAMTMGRPVVCLALTKLEGVAAYNAMDSFIPPMEREGAISVVRRASDLAPTIRTLLSDAQMVARMQEKSRSFLVSVNDNLDGMASQRTADYLEELCQVGVN